jgi:hypothetical protein
VVAGAVVAAGAVVVDVLRHGELLLRIAVLASEMLANSVQASGGKGWSAPLGRK